MTLQYLSDLHLEFPDNREWLRRNPIEPSGDILVVAGDTYHLGPTFATLDFWDFCADNFRHTYVIPGNHEYYKGYDIGTNPLSFEEALRPNVTLLNNSTVTVDGVRLICSTMWSRVEKHPLEVARRLTDFRLMRHHGQAFTIADFNAVHDRCWSFLAGEIARPGPKVVVTHHLPADACNAPVFRGSLLNEGFCVDKSAVIVGHDIAAWVYGHSHRNVADFQLGGTWLLCNQLGYVGYGEHGRFATGNCLEIFPKA